ncbi:hypothetical protein EBH_0053450 [Eimeria brunetti]|uniref:Uncharacterized protein n=1 Tax=Eimeria brunetti TaxID=51314 RepID=U6LS26_9EIME|nr:hypothetical protein EBH_0053450 [Eimeria brunetti]
MPVSSSSAGRFREVAAPDVLQLFHSIATEDRKQQQIQRGKRGKRGEGETKWGRCRGGSAAVSVLLFASVLAVLFLVSRCLSLIRHQQQQELLLQSARRLAAEKETGDEKPNGGDSNFFEHICEGEREDRKDVQWQITTSSIIYRDSDRHSDLNPFEGGKEVDEIEEDGDDDDEPPKKKQKDEMELYKEERSFSLTPSFAVEMYAPASPTSAAAEAAEVAAAAESIRESILQYVEEILAEDNGNSEEVEEETYFSSLLSELNMIVGTQSIDEMQQQQHKLQQQQQWERKQQVLIDQFSNAAQSVVVIPANFHYSNRYHDNGKGEEAGEENKGEEGNGEGGEEGEKNDGTNGTDNDNNDDGDLNSQSDYTNGANNDGSGAGDEGAADDDDNDSDSNNDTNNANNAGDANDGDADTNGDNFHAGAEDNDDAAVAATAAAAADDDIDDDTAREEGDADGRETETKPEADKETHGGETDEDSEDSGEEDYEDGSGLHRNLLPDVDVDDDVDENDEDDDNTDTADEGTSAGVSAAAAAVPADYDNSLEGALVVQRQQQKRSISNSNSSKGQTLHFSFQAGASYLPYQGAVVVDPPGRLPAKIEEEMNERRRRKGRKERHFKKQFIFVAGRPNAKGAYMVVCREVNYQGKQSLLLYWMPFLDSAIAGKQQQRQRQQQQQQQDLRDHPFFRLPSVSPSASVRSFTRKVWTSKQTSTRMQLTLSALHALLAIKDVLKKQQPLTSEDLLKLLENLEQLVAYSVYQGQEVVDHIRPAHAVTKLGAALLMTDAMFAAAEVLGEKAKKNEWWKDIIATLPVYRRLSVGAASRHTSQKSLVLLQLLQSALEAYKGGQRPPPLFLVPLKQILLCTHAVHGLSRGNWTRLQRDDQEWQLVQAQLQQEKVQQQQAQQLQAQPEMRQQGHDQVRQQVQEVHQQLQEQVQEAQHQQVRQQRQQRVQVVQQQQAQQQAEASARNAAAGAAASAAENTGSKI